MRKVICGTIIIALLLSFRFPLVSMSPDLSSTLFGHNWSESAFALEVDLNDRAGSYSIISDLTPGKTGQQEEDSNTIVDYEQLFAYINTSKLELAVVAQERWQEEIKTEIQVEIQGVPIEIPLTTKINSSFPLIGFLGHLEHLPAEYYFGGVFLGLMLTRNSISQDELLVGYPLSDSRLLEGLQSLIKEKTGLNHSLRSPDSFPLFEARKSSFQIGISYRNFTLFWHNESLSDGIILGSSSFGVATFSWLNFSFMLRPNFGHIEGRAVATLIPSLNVGPVTFLAMTEDEIPSIEWSEDPKLIEVELDLREILGLPEEIDEQPIQYKETFRYGVYRGVDIPVRLSMDGGLNLSILMALNGYSSSSEDLEITSDGLPVGQILNKFPIGSNLTINNERQPVFFMNQQGKDGYLSYDLSGEPSLKKAYLSGIPSSSYSQISQVLYDEEYSLLTPLLNPFIGNTSSLLAQNSQFPSNLINWRFSEAIGHYIIELSQWNGMKLSYDSEFLFFLVDDSKRESQTSSSVSVSIFGILLSLISLSIIQKHRSKKKGLDFFIEG